MNSRSMKPHLLWITLSAACLAQNNLPVPVPGNVTLPLDEYNQLVDRAQQSQKPPIQPPVPFVLNSAEMRFDVDGELVSGTVSISGEVLSSVDRMTPLVKGMVIRAARSVSGQQSVPLPVTQDSGTLSAVLSGGSPFMVALDASVPLTMEPGKASFNLSAPQASAVRAILSFPGEETQVNLAPGLITNRSSSGGRTTIEATLAPGTVASVWWASRLSDPQAPAAPKPARFLSDVKTLISVGEAELSIAALAEITVVEGEPARFIIRVPEGYELTGATGPTLASSETQQSQIILNVTNSSLRTHRFLISLARSNPGASAEAPLITFEGTQRETGEVLVEGEGAMELTATEQGSAKKQSSLRRMDLKETNSYLRSMARATLHTAFRYQKKPDETPTVMLEWVRFPAASLLAAAAQDAVVTTLVTSEGRSLTEVKLTLRNQSQPFLKLDLPAGASILSAEVAGEKVKPVEGSDGDRVPLLRPGFRPADSYTVSFVILHAGAPFAKKGGTELALPKMDVPIAHVAWEVFLPDQYKVANFGGDVLPERWLSFDGRSALRVEGGDVTEGHDTVIVTSSAGSGFEPGDMIGIVTDAAGAVVAGARVVVRSRATGVSYAAVTDSAGRYRIANVPTGQYTLIAGSLGFKTYQRIATKLDPSGVIRDDIALQVGNVTESVTVTAEAPLLNTESAEMSGTFTNGTVTQINAPRPPDVPAQLPSANVTNLQRRVTGVLPIAIDVPRAGKSYRFARALVIDEETRLSFQYKSAGRNKSR